MGTLIIFLLIKHICLKKSIIITNKFHLRLAVLYYYFKISLICSELLCSKDMNALDFKNNTLVIIFVSLTLSFQCEPSAIGLFISLHKNFTFFSVLCLWWSSHSRKQQWCGSFWENIHTFYLIVSFLISEKTFNRYWYTKNFSEKCEHNI